MSGSTKSRLAGMLAAAAALAGCGSADSPSRSAGADTTATQATATTSAQTTAPASSTTSSTPSTASKTPEKLPTETITLKSSANLKPIPPRYTCDGSNISLPLSWSKVPRGTAEVDVFVLSALPVKGKFVVAWGVTGLSPRLHKLSSTHLPPGAVVGRNSFGQQRYSVCPPKGSTGQYAVLLYALPHKVAVKSGFDPETLVEYRLVHVAASQGELFFSYSR
jgi:phosphatidylethanolamine-binding protein (PEBP) family uncharacterized protein